MHTGKFIESCTLSDDLCFDFEVKTKHESIGNSEVCVIFVSKYGVYGVSFSTYTCTILMHCIIFRDQYDHY
jgi:hypothetical protein